MTQLKSMPLDVAAFAERAVQCQGWLNRVIADSASDYAVEHALTRLRCDTLAADGVALCHKYAQSPRPLQALDAAGDASL